VTRSENERAERFLELLNANQRIFQKIARAYCRRAADRDDLISDITAALWKSFRRYDPTYSFSTWAYRIALNVAISYYRSARRRSARDAAAEAAPAAAAPAAESEGACDERVERLHAFIAGLPDMDKALVLLYLDENPYKTIAAILGLSETNVATKLGRLKARARAALQDAPNP
jgi:RNA polymerase sigma-70 factor (ECF subfamily)